MPRLLVDISPHGYGHVSQTAPVLNALTHAVHGLEITVRSGVPIAQLKRRIEIPFLHIAAATDFGYVMHNAIDLDLNATAVRYRDFHRDWDAQVAQEAAWLRAQQFDAVLANAAYLPLAGAAQAQIPAIGMSSLNWADLFHDNFADEPWSKAIYTEMRDAYGSAQTFLRITPGLPMDALDNLQIIGPVCRIRSPDRLMIAHSLGIDAAEKWLLVAMGGMDFPLDISKWPRLAGVRYLVPASLATARSDVTVFESAHVDFTELLAAADVVLTKPGYGTFVEAACHGRPVLYLTREHWAEQAHLAAWLHAHTQAQVVEREKLLIGDLEQALEALAAQPARTTPIPTGIAQAVDAIAAMIARA